MLLQLHVKNQNNAMYYYFFVKLEKKPFQVPVGPKSSKKLFFLKNLKDLIWHPSWALSACKSQKETYFQNIQLLHFLTSYKNSQNFCKGFWKKIPDNQTDQLLSFSKKGKLSFPYLVNSRHISQFT